MRLASRDAGRSPHDEEERRLAVELNAAMISLLFFVFVLAMSLGIELIRKVPSQLHTPLMSGSNAISGITIVGAILALGHKGNGTAAMVLAGLAVAFATINVVGGYLVTDRMLGMFKSKDKDGVKR
jgi:NAD(P) transhydrogenase subunit alpha